MAVGQPRSAPLSVEDMLARQKAEREAASKPKFLTKAQRAEEALKRRQAEMETTLERQQQEKDEREKLERAVEEERKKIESARYGTGYSGGMHDGPFGGPRYGQNQYQNGGRGGGPAGPRGGFSGRGGPPAGPRGQYAPAAPSPLSSAIPTGPRGSGSSGPAGSMAPPAVPAASSSSAPSLDEADPSIAPPTSAELDLIRSRYLGVSASGPSTGPKKPRARKLADKKFVFDWDAAEDTTAGEQGSWRLDLLAGGPGQAGRMMTQGGQAGQAEMKEMRAGVAGGGTMFGGRLAGYDEGGRTRGKAGGASDNHADSLERRRAGRQGIDDRHWTDKSLDEMKDRDWRIFREDFSIATKGGKIPHPLRSWKESSIPAEILRVIDEIGYTEPSPIQRQAIPIGLQNRDLVGIAQTGSGKTASFVIPMLNYIGHLAPLSDENRHLGPYALIMAPTRELAQQIESETKRFSIPLGYKTVSIVGGRSVDEQQYALREGAEIIIATPGRLKDILDRSVLVLSQCRYVVMDEADRMVDLGFEVDLTAILDAMPADKIKPEGPELDAAIADGTQFKDWRVTTLFSATMPPVVERLTKKYLRSAATVIIGNAGEAVDTVEQRVEFVQGDDKRKTRLQEILRTIGLPPPMIVFVNQKKTADMVVKYVQQAGRRATTLHSGKNQEQREAALQSLRDGEVEVLVATDLAGRGIDVPDVSAVINWQMASTIEKYVHRIGRTGRAGKTGIAITFLGNEDEETMYDLKQEITKSPISTMNPELAHHQAAKTRITREMKRKRDEEE